MIKSMRVATCLAILAGLTAARPAQAQQTDPTVAFQTNVQKSIDTLNQMQALFARIDQRHKDQAAGVGVNTAPQSGAMAPAGEASQ